MRATTDLYDDFEDSCQTCSLQFRDFGARKRFHGPVRTVECFEDNVLFRQLLGEPGDGAVVGVIAHEVGFGLAERGGLRDPEVAILVHGDENHEGDDRPEEHLNQIEHAYFRPDRR